ncbi:AraC family ligand binding domain-containing protein [Neorhizobium sp. BETTINA12A]|uniref:AraC family ligand binding domain-containing protein n=1 Tax=Neorhizobium sp. BETTINA12A TaxID=2908924 RepID=UPI001FF52A2F|nr:AraC family ligand binding domain-containing protein [Neorhizobium sp. BETTINA12A]MCJ9750397.1 AraC family ligand binding domain-containing protein [Neorhizobium sp. BETTINA12A]
MSTALIRDLSHGLMSDFSDTEFPSQVYGFRAGEPDLLLRGPGTLFGFVWTGEKEIVSDGRTYRVGAMQHFSIPVESQLSLTGSGTGYGVLRIGYIGLASVGGPVEERGRLKYIDGCSDTLLISPPLRGDPCFNFLHFPTGIDQTKHTHPSIRAGLIHKGSGVCHTAEGTETLSPGKMFILYPDAIHAFSTDGTQGMSLTVFHPDSDFGPTHDEHPMLNRTIVNGVSARHLDGIRTTEIV